MTILTKKQKQELEVELTEEQIKEFSNGRGDMPNEPPKQEGDK